MNPLKILCKPICTLLFIFSLIQQSPAFISDCKPTSFATAWGVNPNSYTNNDHAFSTGRTLKVSMITSSAPANILLPAESLSVKLRLQNVTKSEVSAKGVVDIIEYGIRNTGGSKNNQEVYKIQLHSSIPIEVSIPALGYVEVGLNPEIPERFGSYALIVKFEKEYALFAGSVVRTIKPDSTDRHRHSIHMNLPLLSIYSRLGVTPLPIKIPYKPTDASGFDSWYKENVVGLCTRYADASLPINIEFIAGYGKQPLDRFRQMLDNSALMSGGTEDGTWLPQQDLDFEKFVRRIANEFGFPKGPVNSVQFAHDTEAGFNADRVRYREIVSAMQRGVSQGNQESGNRVVCDSAVITDNIPTGNSPKLMMIGSEDRVASTLASYSFMKKSEINIGCMNAFSVDSSSSIKTENKNENNGIYQAFPVAPAIAAYTKLVGNRAFKEVLFDKGLPWVMIFEGAPDSSARVCPDDGVVVVIGELGPISGYETVPNRTVRSLSEAHDKLRLEKRKMFLPPLSANGRRELRVIDSALAVYDPLRNCRMSFPRKSLPVIMYDFYGNSIEAQNDSISIPLNGSGYYLRTDGSKGSFAQLLKALRSARVEGLEAIEIVCHDFPASIDKQPTMRLTVKNILNRSVSGFLDVSVEGLIVEYPKKLTMKPFESKEVFVKMKSGKSAASNCYKLLAIFNGGADGTAYHTEEIRVNTIVNKSIVVDGELNEWEGVAPQIAQAGGAKTPLMGDFAWVPAADFNRDVQTDFACGYTAYDDRNFYFAVKIADTTREAGQSRFAVRNDDAFFYPPVSYVRDPYRSFFVKESVWDSFPTNKAALLKKGNLDRIMSGWASDTGGNRSFVIDIASTLNKTYLLSLYCVAPQSSIPLHQKIEIIDTVLGATLDSRMVDGAESGVYLMYEIQGTVRIKITSRTVSSAAISGLFFDKAPGDKKKKETTVRFVKADSTTGGTWKNVYGGEGRHVAGVQPQYPKHISVATPVFIARTPCAWPKGVRQYSYRMPPAMPGGSKKDNVQIVFELDTLKTGSLLPSSDSYNRYEYLLNNVSPKNGGGTELFRLQIPQQARTSFMPREERPTWFGAVKDCSLVIRYDARYRIVEMAIPWAEIPLVKERLDKSRPIRFSFLVNNGESTTGIESTHDRSFSIMNSSTFHPDREMHWSCDAEFWFEK